MEANTKRRLVFTVKLVITLVIFGLIFGKVTGRDNAEELWERLSQVQWLWLVPAALAQLTAIGCGVYRWDLMLRGQGIRAPLRHLTGSFMIGRYFGAVTPGGLGLQGYRLYDIANHTGKTARSTATVAIETLAGQMGFAATVLLGSVFGLEHLGLTNVLLIDAFFLGLISVAVLLIIRPTLFRVGARALLGNMPTKLQTLVDAVCAYQGQGRRVVAAFLLSSLVHVFNNLIYVCAAKALGADLTAGQVFFVSSIQIFATIVPISINGVGLREAAALGIYSTFFGVPPVLAVLIPILGFAVEMSISVTGGLVLMLRPTNYAPKIEVDDPEREDQVHAGLEEHAVELPEVRTAAAVGLSAGAISGLLVGLTEGSAVLAGSSAELELGVLWYGGLAYGLLGALIGLGGAVVLAVLGRLIRRQAVPAHRAFGRYAGLMFATLTLPLALFRIRRDLYADELVWKSKDGVLVFLGTLVMAGLAYLTLSTALRLWAGSRAGRFLVRGWGGPAVAAGAVLCLFGLALARPVPEMAASGRALGAAPTEAKNVLVIVVDTLRADALSAYGYERGGSPNLDRFASDAIRYDQHFANASWTRPSFASILTGRFPTNHGVMSLNAPLPGEVTTLAEAFADGGYYTAGVVTNTNVSPMYNFHQGFDEYRFLEPNFVMGANDTQSKLLLVQAMRRVVQRFQAVSPGSSYQDAETVNRSVVGWLDRHQETTNGSPFMLFVGYMDPHDPYFAHPYDGVGYDKASHQEPGPDEAEHLRGLYDQEVTYWDEHFGRLMDELRRRGLYDDMTIVVTSDHGEEFMDHGGYWHGFTLYDEQIRVPLLVKRPGNQNGGSVVRHWTQSVDLMPSLLQANGLPAVAGVQGGLLDAGSPQVFAEESHHGNVLRSLRMREDGQEVKLITANAGNPRGLGERELYRVDVDPGERDDRAEREPAVVSRVEQALDEAEVRLREGAARPAEEVDMSCEQCQQLARLGYVDDCDSVCGS